MTRSVLPARRPAETFEFEHSSDRGKKPLRYTATIGRNPEGEISEVFLNSAKRDTDTDVNARDAAIAISIALQHGAPVDVLRRAVTRNGDGQASSPIGKLLDMLEGGAG